MKTSARLHSNLIFDFGMHRALDTRYYLDKGFRVVALEANPALAAIAAENFRVQIQERKLKIVNRALWSGDEDRVTFYVNDIKDDWSSLHEGSANREKRGVREIVVPTTNLDKLFSEHGLPYYIKCDLEGADEIFVDQLCESKQRPSYVSIEATNHGGLSCIAKMYALGYDRMQICNQAFNQFTPIPNPSLEGEFVDVKFNGHMSGLFGKELPSHRWKSLFDAVADYIDFIRLKSRDESLAHGWTDMHFTTRDVLNTG